MNIDEEYAEKKKIKENDLCQRLIAQQENKQTIYEIGKTKKKNRMKIFV